MRPTMSKSAPLFLMALAMCTGHVTHASTRTWPGAAPCSATLLACIQSANQGDRIEIATDAVIDEELSVVHKNLDIAAAAGFHPQLAAGRSLSMTFLNSAGAPGSTQLGVHGLTLTSGCIYVFTDAPGFIVIEDVSILQAASACATGIAVSLSTSPGNTLDTELRIERSRITASLASASAIQLSSARPTQARLIDNLIDSQPGVPSSAPSAFRRGISLSHSSGNATYTLLRNRIIDHAGTASVAPRLRTGVFAASSGTAVMTLHAADNWLRTGIHAQDYGMQINAFAGGITANVHNNTITTVGGGAVAILRQSGDPLPMQLTTRHNIFDTTSGMPAVLADPFEAIVTSHDYNLLHGTSGDVDIGVHSLIAAPEFVSATDAHLSSSSPARDAGSQTQRPAGLPALDGDGMRRVRSAQIDIGAFEFGDASFVHQNPATQLLSTLHRDSLDDQPTALLHISRSDGGGGALFFPNVRPMSQSYGEFDARWSLRADDGLNLDFGTAFNLLQPVPGGTAGVHVATPATLGAGTTALPAAWSTLPADSIFLISATRGAGLSVVANPHPFGAVRVAGLWRIANTDGSSVPTNTAFTVYAQPPSRNAFVHTVSAVNSTSIIRSNLDHPGLNGHRCAAPHVSIDANGQMPTPRATARYDAAAERWYLLDETAATQFEFGNRYFIIADPRLTEDGCTGMLFADGFE